MFSLFLFLFLMTIFVLGLVFAVRLGLVFAVRLVLVFAVRLGLVFVARLVLAVALKMERVDTRRSTENHAFVYLFQNSSNAASEMHWLWPVVCQRPKINKLSQTRQIY